MIEQLEAVASFLIKKVESNKEIYVFPHSRLDGDCIGSAAALVSALRKLNGQASVVIGEPIPERLLFMSIPDDLLILYSPDMLPEMSSKMAAAVAVDCAEASRMGLSGGLYALAEEKAIIDHHVSSRGESGIRYVVSTSSSTAELVLRVIEQLEKHSNKSLLDPFIANILMVGIQSDTGRFSFQNTNADTFRAAAKLMENGANVMLNAYHLFDATSVERMQLMAKAMAGTKTFFDGKLALTMITLEMLRDANASEHAADGLVSSLRDIEGVLVSFVIRESEDEVRVSVRSRKPFDSAAFAELFGGGGHHMAAGFTVRGSTVNEVCTMIIDKAAAHFPEK